MLRLERLLSVRVGVRVRVTPDLDRIPNIILTLTIALTLALSLSPTLTLMLTLTLTLLVLPVTPDSYLF